MNPNRSNRRVHSAEFKTQVLGSCQQPGASVAAMAIGRGLNPNVVRKWLAGQNLKRMGAAMPAPAPRVPGLQFVPVELAKSEPRLTNVPASQPDIRIERESTDLRLTLQCASSAVPSCAALLRAMADTMTVVCGSTPVIRIDTLWLCSHPQDMRADADRLLNVVSTPSARRARTTATSLPMRGPSASNCSCATASARGAPRAGCTPGGSSGSRAVRLSGPRCQRYSSQRRSSMPPRSACPGSVWANSASSAAPDRRGCHGRMR
jgi:transposase-like protein